MATISITFYTNAAESTFILTSVTRTDNAQVPAGITLPITLMMGSPVGGLYPWTGSFTTTDATVPAYYDAVGAINGTVTPTLQIVTNTVPPGGMYATLAMVNQIYSAANVSAWSIAPNTNVPDVVFQQGCFNRADNDIVSAMAMQYFTPPAPGNSVQATNLAWIEAELVGVYLYEANGLQDKTPGVEGKLEAHRQNAMNQLQELMYLNRGQFTRVTGYSDAPLDVQPTKRPDGTPVSDNPLWPRPYWTGNFWVYGGTACNPVGTTFTNRG